MNPVFPIYIISKGRHESRLTSRALEHLKVPYFIIVEKQEYKAYASVIDSKKILILEEKYQREYQTCDPEGDERGQGRGGGPARNFVWEHSIANGDIRHWIVDDNINGFYRLNKNLPVPAGDGTIFKCMEDFVLRYTNVPLAGPNYFMFACRKVKIPPFVVNTRIYSCILIRNDLPFRWRSRYNADTDLSLRVLKAGFCTIQFNAFLQDKMITMHSKGGNTEELYNNDGRLRMAKSLQRQHPDVAKVVWKFHRWHHSVDYRPFKNNKLKKVSNITHKEGVDNYGMTLKKRVQPTNTISAERRTKNQKKKGRNHGKT